MDDRLDRRSASDVIRRAAELDSESRGGSDGLERAALEAAAGEVGISPAALHQALAEHDAGALTVAPGRAGLLGPARVGAVRTVELPADIARGRVDRWLRSQTLAIAERRGDAVVWRRRDDFAAKLRRRVDLAKRVRLGNVDAVIACVAPADESQSVVRLEVDLDNTRRGLITGVVAIPTAAGPVLGGAAGLVMGEIALFAAGVPVGLALGGLGILGGRRTLRSERTDAGRAIDLFLDELEGA